MAQRLTVICAGGSAALETRAFPDGETYLRLLANVKDRSVVMVCTLAHPNDKILPLLFAAAAARDLGASRVGLVAPYLSYMRQDRRFLPGEAVTSRSFAALISKAFDWLATVDPHLHRYRGLDELYRIACRALHAAPVIAAWIKRNVSKPFLVGPDAESTQWVAEVARDCAAQFAVLRKQRLGDREVRAMADGLVLPAGTTPVLLDDIVSSGETLLEGLRLLGSMTPLATVAIAVHGLAVPQAQERIAAAGARLVTTNSVPNADAAIDLADLLASAIGELAG